MNNYDVLVIGGGISGVMSAITAARNGAKTLIIEKYGFMGGMLTTAGVGPMMTYHVRDKQVIQGSVGELIDRLVEKKKSPGHVPDMIGYTYTITPFDAEAMKHELELMLIESGANILYHTVLSGVEVSEGMIQHVTISNKLGLSTISAKVYIDATGDGDLSAWSGVDFRKGRESDGACQPMTMNMRMANVDIEGVKQFVRDNPDEFPFLKGNTGIVDSSPILAISGFENIVRKGKEEGELTFNTEAILFFETNNPGEVIVNTTRIRGLDSTNPYDLTQAEIEGRRQVRNLESFLQKKIRGFENAILLSTGPNIGVRASRQIKGLYTLTLDDIVSERKFNDVIAHGGYPVDVHHPDGDGEVVKEEDNIKDGSMYSVPYTCLLNIKTKNLITVGRCISASFEAQGAIRTTPIVGAIAQGAGAAAYLSVKHNILPVEVDIKELQELLIGEGAYIQA